MCKYKIKKLYDYLKDNKPELDFLIKGNVYEKRSYCTFHFDYDTYEFIYNGWEEHPHCGKSSNEIRQRIPLNSKVLDELMSLAMIQAEKEYDKIIEKEKRERKLVKVKKFLISKVFENTAEK